MLITKNDEKSASIISRLCICHASVLISINVIFKRIVLPIDPLECFVQVLE